MGLFSNLFSLSSGIEKELEEFNVPLLQPPLTSSEAKSLVRGMIKQVKEESLKEGTSKLTQDFGENILQNEAKDKNSQLFLEKRRRDGVKDDDIRWYWGMGDLERRMMAKVDDFFKGALYIKCKTEDGLNAEDAAKKVRKCFPIYGDSDDTSHSTGDDRPLPGELKDRVNRYIERRNEIDPEKCKREIEESSTFNAFVRSEIRQGNI